MWLRILTSVANELRLVGQRSHAWRIRSARRVSSELAGWPDDGGAPIAARVLAYLRKVDPLAVEEIALCSFERAGFAVWRNRAYTGDGGVDGRVHLPGYGWCPLQVKRYRSHIDPQDVAGFDRVVQDRNARLGVFLHTGRTGAEAWRVALHNRVLIVSGSALVRLIRERRLVLPERLPRDLLVSR